MSYVSISAAKALYLLLPTESYKYIYEKLGHTHKTSLIQLLTGKIKLSVYKMELIRDYYYDWKRNEKFSSTKNNGVFDAYQHSMYYKGLNSYINSRDFQLLSKYNKDSVTEEQKRISKIINL